MPFFRSKRKSWKNRPAARVSLALEGLISSFPFRVCPILLLAVFFAIPLSAQKKAQPKTTSEETQRKDKKGVPKNSSSKAATKKASGPKKTAAISKPSPEPQQKLNSSSADEAFRLQTIANISQDAFENEDIEVRRLAINALGSHAGTIAVMETQTGKILSIVNQEWAVRRSFKPCSTIKLVTGIAGLNENIVDQQGNIRFRNSPMALTDALAYSNNTYFQEVGANLGYRKMISYARALGLGEPTGINIEGEVSGNLPDYTYGSDIFRMYSHGDNFEVTAIQMAVLVSAIANNGKLIVPQVKPGNFTEIKYLRRSARLPQTSLQGVIPGMIGAVNFGTAQTGYDSAINIAGKTGSCIEDGSWTGLFVSVSPAVNPKYSVVVITRGSDERGRYAASIAGKIYRGLRSRLNIPADENIALSKVKVSPGLKPEAAAKLDPAKTEDSDETIYPSGIRLINRKRTKKGLEDDAPEGEYGVSPVVIETIDKNEKKDGILMYPPVRVNKNIIRPRIAETKKDNR